VFDVPDEYAGIEGACRYCGKPIVVEPRSAITRADRAHADQEGASGAAESTPQSPEDEVALRGRLERMSEALAGEQSARRDLEIARELTERRVRRLEDRLGAAGSGDDRAASGDEVVRLEAELARSRREIERLTRQLDASGPAHSRAETAPSTGRPVPYGTRSLPRTSRKGRYLLISCAVVGIAAALWLLGGPLLGWSPGAPAPTRPAQGVQGLEPVPKSVPAPTIEAEKQPEAPAEPVDTVSRIHGNVLDEETEAPVAGVSLTISGEAATEQTLTATADDEGAFVFPPESTGYGAFSLACENLPMGYAAPGVLQGVRRPETPTDPLTFVLRRKAVPKAPKTAAVSGRVLNADGTPAAGFTIWRVSKGGNAQAVARSDRDGTYRLEHGGAQLLLYASGPGTARTDTATLDLQPSESVTRDFVVPPCGRIVLAIHTPDGRTPPRFESCNLKSEKRVLSDPAMMQREGGRFVIPYLVAGVYDLRFKIEGFRPEVLTGIVINDEAPDREFSVTLEADS